MTSIPDVIITEVPALVSTIETQVPGIRGLQGPRGPNITASETPPENPQYGDLWIDMSNA
jgi:hypothetical protein